MTTLPREEKDLRSVLAGLKPLDDAKVAAQLADQAARVRQRLSRVRRTLFVMSGKGGVGKSAVAAQLALAFSRRGLQVGLLDADLNGPSAPRMLGLAGRKWRLGAAGAQPETGLLGVKVASAEFFLEPGEPFRWRGPKDLTPVWLGLLEAGTLRELLSDVDWGALDLLLFDLPPGAASDKPPALQQLVGTPGGAVFVSTPSAVVRSVVDRSRAYARDLGIRSLGLIENMAGDGSPAPGEELLARIPLDPELAAALDAGRALPGEHPVSRLFDGAAARLWESLQAEDRP